MKGIGLILKGSIKGKYKGYKAIGIIVIGALLINTQVENRVAETFTETIEKEWDVDLPQNYEGQKVVRYKGFYGNGVSYIVLKYTNQKDIEDVSQLVEWQPKDSFVQEQIKKCFRFLEEWYDITIEERRQLTRYRDKLDKDYMYYCFKEVDNMSYGVFAWFKAEGELHVIDLTY
ncbi:MAG: hypothetical protein RR324_01855 [Cellulosilyticaceae bacterium]